jgi:dTDP-4-amino-4,6-dideoxygalactose transaminase
VKTVNLSDLTFDEEEERAVVEVLRSGWLSAGQVTQAFEGEFARFVATPHAVAVTNCTAALHLALLALGVGPGDEVLVPSLTFVATVNAVRYVGATPVFVDITSLDDWTISPEAMRRQVTPRTRAVLPMHYAGFPCDMHAIDAIARDHNLFIIEDAAHGPGSWIDDRHVGTIGKVGCFSFFANKNLATGEGGMLVTADDELAQRFRYLRSHGMTTMSWERHLGHAYAYDVVALGFNFRFDEMRAALGRVQLRKLPAGNARRAQAHVRYVEQLAGVAGVHIPFAQRRGRFSHHLFPILLDDKIDRLELMKRLRQNGVHPSVHYPPAHLMSIHRSAATSPVPLTEAVGRRELTLPLHPGLELDDVDYVVETLKACL